MYLSNDHTPVTESAAKHCLHHRYSLQVKLSPNTGWSKATVTNNFSLTNLKDTEGGLTQSFLEGWYAAVSVFRCLKRTMQDKISHFRIVLKWYDGSSLVSPHKYWCAGLILLESLDIWWCFGVWCCLGMSWGVWGRVFVYLIDVLGCQHCYGVFGGYLRVQSVQYEGLLEQTHQFRTILKARFFPHDHFDTSKYQNRRIKAFQKWLVLAIFCIS